MLTGRKVHHDSDGESERDCCQLDDLIERKT